MTEKDMRDWADILAGHNVPDADPQTSHEARTLRQVILEGHVREVPVLDTEAKNRLLTRLEQEGLVSPKKPVGLVSPKKPVQWPVWSLLVAALLLLALNPVVLVHTWLGEAPPAEWQKHALAPQLVIYAKSPAEQAQAVQDLQSKLSGFSPRYYEVGPNQLVEVYIPWPAPQAFMDVLQHYQLRLPPLQTEDGLVRPWIRSLLQWTGLFPRPLRHVVIEVTQSSGG